MRVFPLLAALAILASPAALPAAAHTRQITVGSGMFLGLMRGREQKGAVTVTKLDGTQLGRLTYAGSFVEFQAKGTYNLDFETDDFDLNFAIVKSRESTGAYMLNIARTAGDLRAKGNWEGDPEGEVTLNTKGDGSLVVVK